MGSVASNTNELRCVGGASVTAVKGNVAVGEALGVVVGVSVGVSLGMLCGARVGSVVGTAVGKTASVGNCASVTKVGWHAAADSSIIRRITLIFNLIRL
jgi:hypothetical protein